MNTFRTILRLAVLSLAIATFTGTPARAQYFAGTNTSFATALDFQPDVNLGPTADSERIVQGGPVGTTFYYTFGVADPGQVSVGLGYSSSGFETGTFALYTAALSPIPQFSLPLADGVYYLTLTVTGDVNGGTYGDGSAGDSTFQLDYGGIYPGSSVFKSYAYVVPAAAVPEPSPIGLLLAGLLPVGLIAARRRRG